DLQGAQLHRPIDRRRSREPEPVLRSDGGGGRGAARRALEGRRDGHPTLDRHAIRRADARGDGADPVADEARDRAEPRDHHPGFPRAPRAAVLVQAPGPARRAAQPSLGPDRCSRCSALPQHPVRERRRLGCAQRHPPGPLRRRGLRRDPRVRRPARPPGQPHRGAGHRRGAGDDDRDLSGAGSDAGPLRDLRHRDPVSTERVMDEQARISAEILRNKFAAVIGDMRATLVNTSYSSAISESKECANALYTEARSLVAVDNAVHLCSLAATGADVLDDFQFDLTGEDIIVTNDPYSGGTRIQDFTMIAPLVHEDDIVLYLGVRARMPDVGGELLGGFNAKAGEIWAEGARFTPVKLYRDGRLQKDVLTTILLNSREPDALRLDLDAMLAALRVGRRRMSDIIGRYGIDAVQAAMQWAIDYAGRRVDAQIARWPEGEYTGSSVLAHDCHGRRDLHVRATLRVRGGRVEIDLTESDPQSDRFVNCTAATSQAYALLPILAAMDESTPR